MVHFCCFNHSSIASLTALPKNPLLPPNLCTAFSLNRLSRSSGSSIIVRAIKAPTWIYANMLKYPLGIYILMNTNGGTVENERS